MPKNNRPKLQSRHSRSDAKWRANIKLCYETLKCIIPERRQSKPKLSKAFVLQEAEAHIDFLEDTLNQLYNEQGKLRQTSSVNSLNELQEQFSLTQDDDFQRTYKCDGKLTKLVSDLKSSLSSPVAETSTSVAAARTSTSDLSSPYMATPQLSPVSVAMNLSSQYGTPDKTQSSESSCPGTDILSYACHGVSHDPALLANHPAFLTPSKQSHLKLMKTRQYTPQKTPTDRLIFSPYKPTLSYETDDVEDTGELTCTENIYTLVENFQQLDENGCEKMKGKKRKWQCRAKKSVKPACCRQLQKDYITEEYGGHGEGKMINDITTHEVQQATKSLAHAWHGLQPIERDTLYTLASLQMGEPGSAVPECQWTSQGEESDSGVVPQCDVVMSHACTADGPAQLVPDIMDTHCIDSLPRQVCSLNQRCCCGFECFPEILPDIYSPGRLAVTAHHL